MTESEIQCLKDNIDKTVEIHTTDGERLIAKAISVFHSEEYDEHDFLYAVIETSTPEWYLQHKDAGGFSMDFEKIFSVTPHSSSSPRG